MLFNKRPYTFPNETETKKKCKTARSQYLCCGCVLEPSAAQSRVSPAVVRLTDRRFRRRTADGRRYARSPVSPTDGASSLYCAASSDTAPADADARAPLPSATPAPSPGGASTPDRRRAFCLTAGEGTKRGAVKLETGCCSCYWEIGELIPSKLHPFTSLIIQNMNVRQCRQNFYL